MLLSIKQVEAKITEAEQALEFWKKALEIVANPLFAELSTTAAPELNPRSVTSSPIGISPERRYGELKRLTLKCLPFEGELTPQMLADRISAAGYVFRTKTPAISVNDALQSWQEDGKVIFLGRASSNAGLWRRKTLTEQVKDAQGQEATEVAS